MIPTVPRTHHNRGLRFTIMVLVVLFALAMTALLGLAVVDWLDAPPRVAEALEWHEVTE